MGIYFYGPKSKFKILLIKLYNYSNFFINFFLILVFTYVYFQKFILFVKHICVFLYSKNLRKLESQGKLVIA